LTGLNLIPNMFQNYGQKKFSDVEPCLIFKAMTAHRRLFRLIQNNLLKCGQFFGALRAKRFLRQRLK